MFAGADLSFAMRVENSGLLLMVAAKEIRLFKNSMIIDVDMAVNSIVMRLIFHFHFRLCNVEGKFVAAKKGIMLASLVRD